MKTNLALGPTSSYVLEPGFWLWLSEVQASYCRGIFPARQNLAGEVIWHKFGNFFTINTYVCIKHVSQ